MAEIFYANGPEIRDHILTPQVYFLLFNYKFNGLQICLHLQGDSKVKQVLLEVKNNIIQICYFSRNRPKKLYSQPLKCFFFN